MIVLPDVNVLVALAWPNHVLHGRARAWFEKGHRKGWATCPVTESGFVRVSANRRVMPIATTPQRAIELLRRMTGLDGHTFWTDETSIARSRWIAAQKDESVRPGQDREYTDWAALDALLADWTAGLAAGR